MKAVRFHSHGGPEVLRLDDIPEPVSQPGEALVRLRTAGVNYADIYQRTGVTPTALPHIGGVEGVGVVETAAGGLPAGTRVMWTPHPGAYAEFVAVPVWKLVAAWPPPLKPSATSRRGQPPGNSCSRLQIEARPPRRRPSSKSLPIPRLEFNLWTH